MDVTTVSYTHLDVYKRQMYTSSHEQGTLPDKSKSLASLTGLRNCRGWYFHPANSAAYPVHQPMNVGQGHEANNLLRHWLSRPGRSSRPDCMTHFPEGVTICFQWLFKLPQLLIEIPRLTDPLHKSAEVFKTALFCLGWWLDSLCRYLSVCWLPVYFVPQTPFGLSKDQDSWSCTSSSTVNWIHGWTLLTCTRKRPSSSYRSSRLQGCCLRTKTNFSASATHMKSPAPQTFSHSCWPLFDSRDYQQPSCKSQRYIGSKLMWRLARTTQSLPANKLVMWQRTFCMGTMVNMRQSKQETN